MKEIKIYTSPINRLEPIQDNYIPKNKEEFMAFMDSATNKQLLDVGFLIFDYTDESEKYGLFLFPGKWYDVIPNWLEVTGINLKSKIFIHGVSDDDTRFGCLPYEVIREI